MKLKSTIPMLIGLMTSISLFAQEAAAAATAAPKGGGGISAGELISDSGT